MRGNIFLCGLSGSGKSSIAPLLARLRSAAVLDTDDMVAGEAGCSIAQIFAREGEGGFRRREARAVERACAAVNCVVALGGGALDDEASRARVAGAGTLVFLDAPLDVLKARLRADDEVRPLLSEPGALERLRERRLPTYRCADLIVQTGDRIAEALAIQIDLALRALPESVR